jgi:hypothetical protein
MLPFVSSNGGGLTPAIRALRVRPQGRHWLLLRVQRGSRARDGADAWSHTEASVIVCRLTPHDGHT